MSPDKTFDFYVRGSFCHVPKESRHISACFLLEQVTGIEPPPRALREPGKFAQQGSGFSAFPGSECGAGLHLHPQTSGGSSSTLPCAKRKQAHKCLLSFGAGNGNRTRITSLGSWSFAIRLYLRVHIFYLKSDCLSTPKIIFLASYPIRASPRIQRHCIKVSV